MSRTLRPPLEHEPLAGQWRVEHDRIGRAGWRCGRAGERGSPTAGPRPRWWPGRRAGGGRAPTPASRTRPAAKAAITTSNWASFKENPIRAKCAPPAATTPPSSTQHSQMLRPCTRWGRTSRRSGWRSSPSSTCPRRAPHARDAASTSGRTTHTADQHVEALPVRVVEVDEDHQPPEGQDEAALGDRDGASHARIVGGRPGARAAGRSAPRRSARASTRSDRDARARTRRRPPP